MADYILNFEKRFFQRKLIGDFKNDKSEFQAGLKMEYDNQLQLKANKYHYNFEAILNQIENLSSENKDTLVNYRNIAFHNDVPIGSDGSFAWLTKEESEIRKILQITENMNIRKDNTTYLPGGEKYNLNNPPILENNI